MSKYDFKLDLENDNSLSIIIDMIKTNSRILEFGPANGRLTKYLSKEMNCKVDIVEIDAEAGKEASKYSEKNFIGEIEGDIEKYQWLKELNSEKYDYIIFADVLEHLKDPRKVLINCKKILKKDGSILLSVPNIAHNSVIIDLINDEFKYNEIGLLDNTHISFFSYKSLVRMICEAGYKSVIERATHSKVGENEMKNTYNSVSNELAKELKKRENSDIYQFVFKLKKAEYVIANSLDRQVKLGKKQGEYVFTCYIKEDDYEEYTENKCVKKFINPNNNIMEIDLSKFNSINEFRIDIIEANCLIHIKEVYTIVNDEKIKITLMDLNGFEVYGNIYMFTTNDPQIYFDAKGIDINRLYFEYDFIDYDSEVISKYDSLLKELINNNNVELQKKENSIEELNTSLLKKENSIEKLNISLLKKENSIEELNISLVEKENQIQEINNILENYKMHYHWAIEQRDNLNIKLVQRETEYNIIANSASWKITKPVRAILDSIKKLLKANKYTHMMCKGVKCLKENGFKYTVKRVKYKFNMSEGYKEYSKQNILTEEEKNIQANTKFDKEIKFSIIVPIYNTPKNFLCEMINSCINQTYENWELCLADGSDKEHEFVGKVIKDYIRSDKRIKYKSLKINGGISENTNECIKMSNGEYIALFDHDDVLHPSALFEYMKVICEKDADFIYCDEDKFENDLNKCFDPYFKPDFAIDNLRANNYICHFTVFKKELLDKVGLFRKEFDGSQDHDMILRLTERAQNIVHVPKILYHWRVSSNSVASDPYAKPYTIEAGIEAVKQHLERCNLKANVESSTVHPNFYKIRYDIIGNPLISILIPNKDHIVDISRCINSILEKSTYKNIEIIIIENNSIEKETFDYYKSLEKFNNITVVTYESNGKFNYSAINNFGVKFAQGKHLLFLNNDIEIISENWLEEMLMYSQRNDVGAVGAKLYYPNDTIQHAGVILGIGGVAGHSHKYFDRKSYGYFARCVLQQNLSSVTAACLMMKKDIFDEINGFDETFEVAFNDVDLCMRIRESGYLIAWTPYAEAYHYESISRGYEDTPEKQARFNGEVIRFKTRWGKQLEQGDPYYNPNLTLEREDFTLR